MKKENPFPHYWICDLCATERGGVCEQDGITMTAGKCEYCGNPDITLIPVCDFDWPKHGIRAQVPFD